MGLNHLLLFLALVCVCSAGKHDIYSRYSVHGIQIRDRSDQRFLHELQLNLDVDIWRHGVPERRDALVMVSPDKADEFFKQLDDNGLVHYLHLADVAQALEEQEQELTQWRQNRNSRMVFQDYPRYAEVEEYMERLATEYPNWVTVVNAGPSFEGRPVKYVKISTTNFADPSKPIYFMDAMMHAREWVTTPVALYSMFRLVEEQRTDELDLLEDIDWIILPVVNPDGYEYSHTDNRMWRRTRSINLNVSTTCVGVDANRNFDIEFNTIGVSSNPCSDIYPGHEAFSEAETRYIRDIVFEHLDRMQLYNNIHSHGNYVLFGFDNLTLPDNAPQLHHVAAAMGAVMDAQKLPEADYYIVGNSAMVMYGVSGSAQDYVQDVGVPFSYTMELPGYGFDFRVPPSYIDHINEETWQGIAETARHARAHYRSRYNAQSSGQR